MVFGVCAIVFKKIAQQLPPKRTLCKKPIAGRHGPLCMHFLKNKFLGPVSAQVNAGAGHLLKAPMLQLHLAGASR